MDNCESKAFAFSETVSNKNLDQNGKREININASQPQMSCVFEQPVMVYAQLGVNASIDQGRVCCGYSKCVKNKVDFEKELKMRDCVHLGRNLPLIRCTHKTVQQASSNKKSIVWKAQIFLQMHCLKQSEIQCKIQYIID